MRPQTAQKAIPVILFAATMVLTCGMAAVANAQSPAQATVVIRFTLPFEVDWGTKVVPPGQYRMYMDNSHPAALVESADGKTAFFTPIPTRNRSYKGPAALVVLAQGNERMVRSLNLPKSALSLTYQPATNAEREIIARADHTQTVPLTRAAQ